MKILAVISLLFSIHVSAAQCRLPGSRKLIIGCSFKCDAFFKIGLKWAAWKKGYKIEVKDMRKMGEFKEALSLVDAVIIPGGADIHPRLYLPYVTADLQTYTEANLELVNFSNEGQFRDDYEHDLVGHYVTSEEHKDLPLLGICRGMQMMAVAKRIPLYLDIKTELGIPNRYNKYDRVEIVESSSLMSRLYPSLHTHGYKYHHQGIRVPYFQENEGDFEGVQVTAYSHAGRIAEAFEYLDRPALGVQFHPEKSLPLTSRPVWDWLLTKACERANKN